jgi:hypothetical protein
MASVSASRSANENQTDGIGMSPAKAGHKPRSDNTRGGAKADRIAQWHAWGFEPMRHARWGAILNRRLTNELRASSTGRVYFWCFHAHFMSAHRN